MRDLTNNTLHKSFKMPPKKPATKGATKPSPGRVAPAKTAAKKTTATKTTGGKKPAAGKPASKPGGAGKGKDAKAQQTAAAKPKKNVWTEEDHKATVIQSYVRMFLAKCSLKRARTKKREYEEMMEQLEREAFLAIVKKEQEQAEKEREKEDAERRRMKRARERMKRMLEAAFEGDKDEILTVLKETDNEDTEIGIGHDTIGRVIRAKHQLNMIDCEDANSNTPLSEAASGGQAEVIKLLLERGADVNSRGQFERTPLYRAAFAGHFEAVQVLLQNGGDPRIYASDGATPEHICSVKALKELLAGWDISITETMLTKIESYKEKRKEEERQRHEAEMAKLENQLAEAKKDSERKQLQLNKAYCELNKRITEHDKCALTGNKTDITLKVVQDFELDLEMAKLDAEKARDQLAQIKLQIREQQKHGGESEEVGFKVNIKELDDVLLRDVGGKIQANGRWPLVIDPSARVATFLRYRDTNYINALNPTHMEPEVIRNALLGAIRYGKPLVVDMMEVDMYETCTDRFNEIHKGLMDDIMSKEIIKNEKYTYLIKDTDGDEYNKNRFNDFYVQNFKFILLTKIEPEDALLEKTYPLRVVISDS
ncbi:IQ motif and ankyrin repeat domain-containing protein 1-like [Amphiura filiformis]|uniref:IQ motif and ankyrin repeat domain-containing protein 1-like n=1 Tax=Amphiura filiformis TaxID=82378 RepID=UPI003B22803A